MRNLLFRLLSPFGLLLLPGASYFFYCANLDFQSDRVASDVLWLGVATAALSVVVFSRRLRPIRLERGDADAVLNSVLPVYALLAAVVFVGTGGRVSALLDDRFSVPGLGVIYPFFTIGALLVFASWTRCTRPFAKILFLVLFLYIGVVVGGKSFFMPAIMGMSFSALSDVYRPPLAIVAGALILAAASIAFVLLSVSDNLELMWWILSNRIAKSADSVELFSRLSLHEIEYFPISAGAFFLDIFLRFFGQRINTLSVGSAIEFDVTGDASGAGPNPTLPILAYLVEHGNPVLSGVFLFIVFGLVAMLLRWCARRQASWNHLSLYFGAAVFSAPLVVVDLVMYLQELFSLSAFALIAALQSRVIARIKKNEFKNETITDHGDA